MYRLKFVFLFLFVLLAANNSGKAQDIKAVNIKAENLKDQVVISYDINNPDENTILVELQMKKKSDKTFRYIPKYLSGDIGEGDFNGNKKIIWNKQKERLPMINMDDFYFEINVKVLSTNDHTWLWVGAGAAVLGGGAALYYLLKDNKDDGKSSTMPEPPGRP